MYITPFRRHHQLESIFENEVKYHILISYYGGHRKVSIICSKANVEWLLLNHCEIKFFGLKRLATHLLLIETKY